MNDFDALLAELDPLAKAMAKPGEGEGAAAAAAGTAAAGGADGEGEGAARPEGEAAQTEDDELLGKSFAVTLADGTVTEAFDGTTMMKAMAARLETVTGRAVALEGELEAARGELAKSLTAAAGLLGLVKGQDALLKALRADVDAIGNAGRGRQAVVTPLDKGTVAPLAAAAAPDGNALMAKAMTLAGKGEMSAQDIARIEGRLNAGIALPADLAARLAA